MRDGYDWRKYSAGATLGTGGETRREIQIMSEFRAGCLWQRYLVQRYEAGDPEGVADAIKVLEQSARWPGARSMREHEPTTRLIRSAQAGDYDAIRQFLVVNCAERSLGASEAELRAADARWAEWKRRNADAIADGRAHAGARPSTR